MTDHATRAREIVMAIDLTTASAVDGSIELIAAALTRAAEEAKGYRSESDEERWLREMVKDYRLESDNNITAHRVAINTYIHTLRAQLQAAQEAVKDHQEVIDDYRRLTKELNGLLGGTATQPSLCDVVAYVRKNPQAVQPVWSTNKPTVGLWLYRAPDGDVTAGKVIDWRGDGDLYFRDAFNSLTCIDEFTGEWAKIPLPREA